MQKLTRLIGDNTITPANLCGIINSNKVLGLSTNLNNTIISLLNSLLKKDNISESEFINQIITL
ncbi:protein of unknown function [Tenacibaculum sp. 190524A05c]